MKKKPKDDKYFDPDRYKNWLCGIVLALTLFSCKDDGSAFNPRDARNIEGLWSATAGGNAVWTLYFSDGYSEHRVIDFGQEVIHYEFAYRTNYDTVFLDNLFSNSNTWNRVWVVEFQDENNCIARDVAQPDPLPAFVMRRIPE